ncbi:hypothetical protein EMPS_00364 [Entomortierella parvispora]|uniref:F-box domain-containing protein n=1 Tax=Entomortierella parvispora TaxID=205924 RepID=A0A9P3LRJ4_9FUNG|nr:hypothetical protein EMPS_00364 [Entomortierella parvispora]
MNLDNGINATKNNIAKDIHTPKDVFDVIPLEILDQILGHLDHASLYNCLTLSTRWSDRVVPHLWASPWMMYYISWTKMICIVAKSAEKAQKQTDKTTASVDAGRESKRASQKVGLSENESGSCFIPSPQVQHQNDGHGSVSRDSALDTHTAQRWRFREEGGGNTMRFTRGYTDSFAEEDDDRSDSDAHVEMDGMWKEEDTRRPLLPKAARPSSLPFDAVVLSSHNGSTTTLRAPRTTLGYGDYIRTLDFSQLYYIISDQFLSHLLPLTPNLVSLTIHSPKQLSDLSLILLAASCPQLSLLDLAGCTKITNRGLDALLENCGNMSSLNLANGTRALSDRTLEGIAKRWGRTLKSLNLANTSSGSAMGSSTMVTGATSTTTARDEENLGSFSVQDPGLLTIAIHCRSLQSLNISQCILHCSPSSTYSSSPALSPPSSPTSQFSSSFTSISLSSGSPNSNDTPEKGTLEAFLSQLPPSLQVLNLRSCFDLSDKGLIALARACPDLRELDITACSLVTDWGVRAIGEGCRQFETLIMDDRYGRVTDQLLKSFPPWGDQLLQRRVMLGWRYSRIF